MHTSLLDRWHLRRRGDFDAFRSCERKPFTVFGTLRLFAFLAGSAFLLAICGYFSLWLVIPEDSDIGAMYDLFKYHWSHPFHQIGLVSLCYALVATPVILSPADPVRRWPKSSTLFIVVLSLIIATPGGGVLWVLHDMRAGHVPEGQAVWDHIGWGIGYAVSISWLVILVSVPYNLFGLVLGHLVTRQGYRMTLVPLPPPAILVHCPNGEPVSRQSSRTEKAAPG
ncbi:MAG: hypothetical protein EOP88_19770 [Verrucomicrobiaceae bacterium]|nr:MAG: hypothetical protein EOP88_19770 [Verrucomicrobiaceae bacterium]